MIIFASVMVSLWKIFLAFTKIGAFTIGGGYMMVPAIEDELRRKGWIPEEELPDMVALSQSAPGLLTVNMSIFAGYRLRGIPGSIAATLGSIIAPFFAILLIAMFFASFKDIPIVAKIFMGVRPVAVGIIAAYAVRLFRKNARWYQWVIALAALAGIAVFRVSAIYILCIIIAGSLGVSLLRK